VISLALQTVHTSGINWVSVLTIVCTTVGALAIILGGIVRYITKAINRTIKDAINQFRIDVVSSLVTEITVIKSQVDNLVNTQGRNKSNDSSS